MSMFMILSKDNFNQPSLIRDTLFSHAYLFVIWVLGT